jgi:hypothetical protein
MPQTRDVTFRSVDRAGGCERAVLFSVMVAGGCDDRFRDTKAQVVSR